MEIPADIAANAAMLRQNVALSVIKQTAENEKAIVNILDQSLSVGPAARGSHINFSA